MEWTKELDYSMRRDIAAAETVAKEQGIPPKRVVLDYGVATKAVAEIDRLKDAAALLRASRGALASGDVAVPRAILERLVDATAWHEGAREAREQAKRILQQATLAAEPARTDPEAARQLADARAEHDQLDAKFRSYDGGDRPQSPPASLIRELYAAEEHVRRLEAK